MNASNRMRCLNAALMVAVVAIFAGAVRAVEVNTSQLSENGWYSDDTRADGSGAQPAGTNLISPTLTDDPEATSSGMAAHDADILGQIIFGTPPVAPPIGTHPGAVNLFIDSSGSGKSQISHRKDDGTGHASGSVLNSISVEYSWMGNGTATVSASFKLGIKTADFGSTGLSPRTGENAWDKVLIYEPGNQNPGVNHFSDGTWYTETVDFTTGRWWFFDRTAVAGTIGTPMTLSDMSTSATPFGSGTIADVYALMSDPGAIITSIQFGIGSANADGNVYVNQLETNFYRAGDTTTFGPPPPVHNVTQDTYFATIQPALNAANAGDVIEVDAGSYAGNITIPTGVTLQSTSGAASTTIDGAGGCAVTVNASDVTIDGFTITNPTGTNAICSDDNSNLAIRNNMVTNVGDTTVPGNHHAILIESSAVAISDITIEDNTITNIVGADLAPPNHGSVSGIVVGFSTGSESVSNLLIQRNTISQVDASIAAFPQGRGAYGILINFGSGGGGSGGPTIAPMILNNTIDDLEGLWAHGIGLEGPTPDAIVTGNSVNDLTDHKMPSDAVCVQVEANPDADSVEISGNRCTDTIVGIQNTVAGTTVNASGNYWDSNDASAVAAKMVGDGDADYTPWLDNGTDTSGDAGFQGDFSTLHVDDDSPQTGGESRIDEAIGLVSGSTINVSPGTYAPFALDESVTLNGAMAGVDARGRVIGAPDDSVESVITGAGLLVELRTGCVGTVIDGFVFAGGTRGIESTTGPIDNVVIQNNHFEGQSGSAMFLNNSGVDMTIDQNVLLSTGASSTALHLDTDNFDGLHVTRNNLIRTGGPASIGLFVDGNHNVGVSGTRSPLISENLVQGHGNGVNLGTRAFEFGEISDNEFLENETGLGFGIQNSLITRNEFIDNNRGIRFTSFGNMGADRGAQDNDVTENAFSGSATLDVFLANDQAPGTIGTNTFFGNSFGSSTAMQYAGAESIDASGNWWGDNSGPSIASHPTGSGGTLDGAGGGNIDFTPWLNVATDTDGGAAGFQGDFSTLNVDDDSPQTGPDGRIEEGIELVTASTVLVMPGTYVDADQVIVDKNVTIIGDPSDRPVLNTSFNTGTGGDSRAWWLIESGNTVSFQNLIFDGSGQLVWNGIRSHGTLDVQNCDFTEIKFNESGPHYSGVSVAVITASGPTTFADCNFSEIGRIGMHIFGEAEITRCNYTGKGVGDWLDYMICVGSSGPSIGNATITSCTASGNRGVASSDGSTSAGMLVSTFFGPGTTADIRQSAFTDNTTGIYVGFAPTDTASVVARYNNISGNDFGMISSSTTTVVDAEYNYWGDASGPADPDGVDEAGSPPCYDPSTMVNADGMGDSVSDLNIDYCPWLEAPMSLSLVAADSCVPVGEPVCISIEALNQAIPFVGGQFFLDYDETVLDFVAASPGDSSTGMCGSGSPTSPIVLEVFEVVDDGMGLIDYASGVALIGGMPQTGDVTMATLEFTALTEVCDVADLITFRPNSPPTRLTDSSAGAILPMLENLGPISIDSTDPMITCPADVMDLECDQPSDPGATGMATATDNCDLDVSIAFMDSSTPGMCADEETITRTWTATDDCGNTDVCMQTIDIVDTTAPVVTCPAAPAAVNAEAGTCDATVTYGSASAVDNCDPAPSAPVCTPASGSSFMDGSTPVTCSSTDDCGNEGACMFDVVVNPNNTVEVMIELQGVTSSVDRCITFTVHNCMTDDEEVVNEVISFTGGAMSASATVMIDVPCGVWDCITAKDELHTLAGNVPLGMSGTNYTADLTGLGMGGDALLCGDATNDNLVDVLDFGALFGQFLTAINPNTTCAEIPPPPFHTDFTGNGVIDSVDFTCLQGNFLTFGDDTDDCCAAPLVNGGNNRPLPNIGVDQLARRIGRNAAAAADVDGNGVVDVRDLNRFAEDNDLDVPQRLYQIEDQLDQVSQTRTDDAPAQVGGRR